MQYFRILMVIGCCFGLYALQASACRFNYGVHCVPPTDLGGRSTDQSWQCGRCGPFHLGNCTEADYIWNQQSVFQYKTLCQNHCCLCQRYNGQLTPCRASNDLRDNVVILANMNPFPAAPCGSCPEAGPTRNLTCMRQACFDGVKSSGAHVTYPFSGNLCANGPCKLFVKTRKF